MTQRRSSGSTPESETLKWLKILMFSWRAPGWEGGKKEQQNTASNEPPSTATAPSPAEDEGLHHEQPNLRLMKTSSPVGLQASRSPSATSPAWLPL